MLQPLSFFERLLLRMTKGKGHLLRDENFCEIQLHSKPGIRLGTVFRPSFAKPVVSLNNHLIIKSI